MDFGSSFTSSASGFIRRRPMETAPADGDIVIRGKFLARDFRGGIDRGAAFVDHYDGDGGRQFEGLDEGFGFAAGGTVADGDGLDLIFFDDAQYGGGGRPWRISPMHWSAVG